nr:hypothetical protein [Gemmatimonadales bacterium]NIN12787.1 hypothetical protein [Gemmatimonadales bacterium]NIN51012.1 hypothetical protein [Gemmatimonadales bacterium]NIP08476.1 hypothetical protein [Gemmatimonadales bacterium]NIR00912.1 hypothetical protein [Gemmatimonadales bacterium]
MRHALLLALPVAILPVPALAQTVRDTTVVAGAHYSAGGFHRFWFGSHYRGLWTAPLKVGLLDMNTFAGGLTPTTAGGGFQTKSLWFRGGDGFQYGFRSVDKDPAVLPPELRGTVVEDLVRDQTSSAHPAAPAVIAPLLEGAGILHTNPRLVVLPDDPKLGEHRERFAGTLGFIERRAIAEPGVEPFAGADEIIDGDEMFERMQRGPGDRIDAQALLRARLFDLLIGDWDRHRGQWGWARFGEGAVRRWVPIPEDRDQALVRFDGFMLFLARIYAPQLVNFGEKYPNTEGVTWNGRELDRRVLVGLERPAWDSAAAVLKWRLTDSVIDAAVAALPPEYYAIDGERLARALKRRRDQLPQAADRFYRLLAKQVAIHGTDQADAVTVDRHGDGVVEVTITSGSGALPFFRRRFRPGETKEIRFYLYDGADRVLVRGDGRGMTLRVIGSGDDVVIDSSRAGGLKMYAKGNDRVAGPTRVTVDRRPYTPPPKRRPQDLPPRDWGRGWRTVIWTTFGPDVGLFIGGGRYVTTYGFRKLPYSARVRLRAGFSTGATTGRADLAVRAYRSNSRLHWRLDALASGIEVLRFHGFGNEIPELDEDSSRVNQVQFTLAPSLVVPLWPNAQFAFGPTAKYSSTKDQAGRIIAATSPYGSGKFGQLGWRGHLLFDTRDVAAAASRGVYVTVGGSVYPPIWDVDSLFGEVHGEFATYLTARPVPLRPTLALRVGGKKVWGRFPFQEAAFIGDAASVRLGRQNRFAGDASVYGNAELRLRLARIFLVLPGDFGVFGLGDVGRVFLDGES